MPQALLHKYQYFNVPVSTNTSEAGHPLQVLRRVAQRGDFVLLKLDLDNTAVEHGVASALLADPLLLELVDEVEKWATPAGGHTDNDTALQFLFEYHVRFGPLLGSWQSTIDPQATLANAYRVFLRLRQRGMRAHSWV